MSDVQTGGLLLALQDVLFPFAAATEGDPLGARPLGPPGLAACLGPDSWYV